MIVGALVPRAIQSLGVALVVVLVGTACLQSGPPQPSSAPAAIASATPTPSPIPTRSSLPAGTFENLILGYRITFPTGYRRSLARIVIGQESLGFDNFTIVTEAQEREACTKDAGSVGAPGGDDQNPNVRIEASRNVRGISAMEWATTPSSPGGFVRSTHMRVEPFIVGGREAVRLIEDNANASTTAFVIRANDRMYDIRLERGPSRPKTWLDDVAKTFVAVEPAAFPSATASVSPDIATAQLGAALARAFAAKDVDAIARLMPDCSIFAFHLVDGQVVGSGGLNRSVANFTLALRDRFAAGDLTVTVDPLVRFGPRNGGEYFVRSEWREADRTTPIDLIFSENEGRWRWTLSAHYYTKAQVINGCIPYRSPWVAGSC